ncbi:MAG: FG-GAP-like repeat-containing protein [Bacteroidota bacterium]
MRIFIILEVFFLFFFENNIYAQQEIVAPKLGYTKGLASVNSIGAATYSLPIKVAPGVNGLQPSLSITYSSNGGNGPLGLGFSMQGLSVISKTSRTVAQDIVNPLYPQYLDNSINFNTNDRFSLDGEQLRPASKNISNFNLPFIDYGKPGSVYYTEQNSFQKIVLIDTINSSPTYFKSFTKDGLIKEYGNTPDSKIELASNNKPLHWFVNKILDRNGNFIKFYYYENITTGAYYPIKIIYSGNDLLNKPAKDSVVFEYEDRPDKTMGYLKGSQIITDKRIKKIVCYTSGLIIRSYSFNYRFDGSFSQLNTIQECVANNICLDPVYFAWKDFVPQYDSVYRSGPINTSILNNSLGEKVYYNADFDGDGLQDLLVLKPFEGTNTFLLNRLNSNDNNFRQIDNILPPLLIKKNKLLITDFNADGKADFYFVDSVSGKSLFFLANYFNDTLSFAPQNNLGLFPENSLTGNNFAIQPQDINNDGLTDFTIRYNRPNSNGKFHRLSDLRMFINSGNYNRGKSLLDPTLQVGATDLNFTTTYFYQDLNLPIALRDSGEIQFVDLDKNLFPDIFIHNKLTGQSAIIFNYTNTSINVGSELNILAANDNSPLINVIPPSEIAGNDSTRLYFNDFNGDGLPDILYFNSGTNITKWWINKGNFQFEHPANINFDLGSTILSTGLKNISIGDFNSDGFSDICLFNQTTGKYKIYINDGQFNFTLYNWLNPIPEKAFKTSIISLPGNYYPNTFSGYLFIDPATGHNEIWQNNFGVDHYRKIISVSEGSNKAFIFYYSTLTGSSKHNTLNTYRSKVSYTTYPTCEISNNFEVVSNFFIVHPILGIPLQSIEYNYEGARYSLNGRGFRGFMSISETNNLGLKTVKNFYQDTSSNIFIGDPIKDLTIYKPSGEIISKSIYKLGYKYFPKNYFGMSFYSFTQQNISTNYELDGSIDNITRTSQQVDDYGNVISSVVDYGNGFKDSTINQYLNDTANWILGRLTYAKLYRFAPNKPTQIKSCSFEYNNLTGQLNKEISYSDLDINQQLIKTYLYDSVGNIKEHNVTAWNGKFIEERKTKTLYDSDGKYIIKKINPLGQVTLLSYDNFGNVLKSISIDSLETSYQYEPFGRVYKTIFPDGNWTTVDYVNYSPNLTDAPAIYNDGFYCSYVIYKQFSNKEPEVEFYDYQDKQIGIEKTSFDGTRTVIEKFIDVTGKLEKESRIHFINETPVYVNYSYDTLGRQIQQVYPGNRVQKINYSPHKKEFINPNGQKKIIITNQKGLIREVQDDNNNSIFYDYDPSDNMLSVTDTKGNIISYTYDLRGYKNSMTDPDLGTYTFEYNAFGELIKQVDPKNNITETEYDILGRVIKEKESEGSTYWLYDQGLKGTGKLSKITKYNGSAVTYLYDSLGRNSKIINVLNGKTYQTTYKYDAYSRLKNLIYPSGFTLKYSYNQYGYLHEIRRLENNFLYWRCAKKNASGQIEIEEQQNNILTESFYNPETLYVDSLRSSNASRFINRWQFNFDNLGNLLERKDILINKSESFQYDNLNRLIKSGVIGDTSTNVSVSYDEIGNIVNKSDVGDYEYGAVNSGPHQVKKINLVHPRCIPSWLVNYEYTSFNKVSKIYNDTATLDIEYDFNQQRQAINYYVRDTLKRIKVYIGDIYEIDSSNGLKKEIHYIRGGNGVCATFTLTNGIGGVTNYWFKDHISLNIITDSVGKVLQSLSFDAWGNRRNSDWTLLPDSIIFKGISDRGFTGHEHYDLFDLIDMNGRIYDPVIGRFLSADPFLPDLTDLQSLNRYSYVTNNPLSIVDPNGYWPGFIDAAVHFVGNAIGGAVNAIGSVISTVANAYGSVISAAASWVKENWKTLVVVAVAVGVGLVTGGAGTVALLGGGFWGGLGAAVLSGAAAGFASTFTAGVLNGQNLGDVLKSSFKGAAIGALSAGLTYGVGSAGIAVREAGSTGFSVAEYGVKVAGHGIVQGGISELNGGKFIHGFYSGAISGGTEGLVGSIDNTALRYSATAAVGGTTSSISGGSFVNGAVTSAYVMMFNNDAHQEKSEEAEGPYNIYYKRAKEIEGADRYGAEGYVCNEVANYLYTGYADGEANGLNYLNAHGYLTFGQPASQFGPGVAIINAAGTHMGVFIDNNHFVVSSVKTKTVIIRGTDQVPHVFGPNYVLRKP